MKTFYTLVISVLLVGFSLTKSFAQFEILGPVEYGQIFDLTYHPFEENVMFARTVGSHIVKSVDHGNTWEIIYSDPLDRYARVEQLRMMEDGTSLSFVRSAEGTDYNALLIFDINSESITQLYASPSEAQNSNLIASYSILPGNNDVVVMHTTYMAGSFSLTTEVFYTSNGGAEWEVIYFSPDNDDVAVNNVALHPENGDRIFLMRGVSPGAVAGSLLVSEDAGSNWEEKIPGNSYSAISFNPENADQVLLGTFYSIGDSHVENIYRSQDGGDTWEIVPIVWSDMSTNSIQSITFNPSNTERIIVLEENEIAVSADNGQTWTNHVYTGTNADAYYFGLTASYNPFDENQILISANYYPYHSADGGETLVQLHNPFINGTGIVDMHHSGDASHLYFGFRNGFIHRDLNTMTDVENGLQPLGFFSNFSVGGPKADKEVPGRIYTTSNGFFGGSMAVSNDHGQNYNIVYSSFFLNFYNLTTSVSNTNMVWVSFGENVLKLDLTNLDEVISTEIVLAEEFILVYGIGIDPTDDNHVWLGQGSNLYQSTDGGAAWEGVTAGLEILSNSDVILHIVYDEMDASRMMLGTTAGIFSSADGGASWEHVYGDRPVYNLQYSSFDTNQIVGVSHNMDGHDMLPNSNAAIVYTLDGGETWEEVGPEMLQFIFHSNASSIVLEEEYAEVYFNTIDLGPVKYRFQLEDETVNVEDINRNDLLIYPNPTNDIVYVNRSVVMQSIRVYDLTGKKVIEISNNNTIDLNELSEGVYLLQATSRDGHVMTSKIVKN